MARNPDGAKGVGDKAEREFVSEAEEILERMREECAALHEQLCGEPTADAAAGDGHEPDDPELVNRLFRSAHTLKGVAGLFGFESVSRLAHRCEDLLGGLRMGRRPLDSEALALLEEIVATFGELLERVGAPEFAEEAELRVASLERRIDGAPQAADADAGAVDPLDGLEIEASQLRALTEYEEHRLRANLRLGRELVRVETRFDLSAFEEGLGELSAAVREVGEIISTLPSTGNAPQSQICFSLLAALRIPASALAARLDFPDTRVSTLRAASPSAGASESELPVPAELEPETALVAQSNAEPQLPAAELRSLKSISDTVRVGIHKLDELMNVVGELALQRGAVGRIAEELAQTPETRAFGVELGKVHHALERQLRNLQAAVLDVRMVPLRQVFEKLGRVLRRLARDEGKEVRLEFSGADTELDKLIVEELIDPLMHIVRNAFDHAIESPDERRAAGKLATGTIRVSAMQRGNHVAVEVCDDGRGIDPELVRARAIELGILAADSALTHKETLDLIFEAGFTTRASVSETSGRGVGMDVVRSNLTSLGGIVEIDSRVGSGTTITLTLPITLAIIQALLVETAEQRFAIPLNAVLETLFIESGEVQHSEGRMLLDLRGEPLVLRRLSRVLGLQTPSEMPERIYVVVLGLGELRLGLIVDRLLGQQDAVLKPIQGPVRQIPAIAGATELGDGIAVLVLDIACVVEESVRRRDAA